MTISLLWTALTVTGLGAAAAVRWTPAGCLVGIHREDEEWRDTSDKPDELGRIYVARHCVRCGAETERAPLVKQWSMGAATLYGPKR